MLYLLAALAGAAGANALLRGLGAPAADGLAAMAGLDGGIQARITALRERLLDELTELEARVDFEDDLPPLDGTALLQELQAVRTELLALVADGERGDALRHGLRVALVGRPNVGTKVPATRLTARCTKIAITPAMLIQLHTFQDARR